MILIVALVTTGLAGFAQPQNNQAMADKVEALRIAYITQQLNLTPEEAQKFWPIYNVYKSELEGLRKNYGGPNLTAEQQLELEQKKLDLKKKYKPQFEGALGTAKLNQLYNLERKFQEKLKELREQRMQQRGAGQGQGGRQWGPR